jgi:hypothetical protein
MDTDPGAYPSRLEVVGVDSGHGMIEYARSVAQLHGIYTITFSVLDILKPPDFPDHSFDLVNGCLIFSFVPPVTWLTLVQGYMWCGLQSVQACAKQGRSQLVH